MNAYCKLTCGALAAAVLAVFIPVARAQGLQERLQVTFSGPVEVPGEVLPAGTYIFEVLESGHLTRVLSSDELHVFATLETVPVERTERTQDSTVVLGYSPEGTPERVEGWFYPGDSIGSEFIYQQHHPKKNVDSIITVGSVLKAPGEEAVHGTVVAAKDVAAGAEYVGVHADHLVVRPMIHALKVLG